MNRKNPERPFVDYPRHMKLMRSLIEEKLVILSSKFKWNLNYLRRENDLVVDTQI